LTVINGWVLDCVIHTLLYLKPLPTFCLIANKNNLKNFTFALNVTWQAQKIIKNSLDVLKVSKNILRHSLTIQVQASANYFKVKLVITCTDIDFISGKKNNESGNRIFLSSLLIHTSMIFTTFEIIIDIRLIVVKLIFSIKQFIT